MKKIVVSLIVFISLFALSPKVNSQETPSAAGLLDESLQDLSVVFGTGAVGAILGLSTLSFADKPKDHLKNVSIGGAIGVVIGVGIVVFGQASRSQNSITQSPTYPLGADSLEKQVRIDFSKQKIAESYFLTPTVGYNFSF
jgi:hypothetical protein